MLAASNLQPGVAERYWPQRWTSTRSGNCPGIPEFEQAGRAAAEQAPPLLRALIAVAQARRDWQQALAESPVSTEVSRAAIASTIG